MFSVFHCVQVGMGMLFVFLSFLQTLSLSTFVFIACLISRYGSLGYGDTANRGDNANEMGDYLDLVDLGTGFEPFDLSLASHHSVGFRCVSWSVIYL